MQARLTSCAKISDKGIYITLPRPKAGGRVLKWLGVFVCLFVFLTFVYF